MKQAFLQMCPAEEANKDYANEWKYDLHKLKVGSGYISSSLFMGKHCESNDLYPS